jgi:hypothetical protein
LVFKLLLDPKEDQSRESLFTPTGKLKIKNDQKGFHFFDKKNSRKKETSKQKERKRVAGGRQSDTEMETDRQAERLTRR